MIKVVMGTVMLIVAISRGAKVPIYLAEMGTISLAPSAVDALNFISFWSLVMALLTGGVIIICATVRGMRVEKLRAKVPPEN
jgi:hypothetical protein